jgi:hypothetical protein
MSGAEGGPGKRAGHKASTAPRSDPYSICRPLSTAAENWIWPTFRDRVSFVWVCRGGLVITHE